MSLDPNDGTPAATPSGVSRRAVATGAAWTIPVIAVAAAAPLAAASVCTATVTAGAPALPYTSYGSVSVSVTAAAGTPITISVDAASGAKFQNGQISYSTTTTGAPIVFAAGSPLYIVAGATAATLSVVIAGANGCSTSAQLPVGSNPQPAVGNGIVWGRNSGGVDVAGISPTDPFFPSDGNVNTTSLGAARPSPYWDPSSSAAIGVVKIVGGGTSGFGIIQSMAINANNQWVGDGLGGGTAPTAVALPSGVGGTGTKLVDVAVTNSGGAVLSADGKVYWTAQMAGSPSTGGAQLLNFPSPVFITQIVAAYNNEFYALDSTGSVWSWGINNSGNAGTGQVSSTYAGPAQVVLGTTGDPLAKITQISSRINGAYALDSSGAVYVWGDPGVGQYGNGSFSQVYTALKVPGLPTIASLATAGALATTSGAIDQNGSIWVWGDGRTSEGAPNSFGSIVSSPVKYNSLPAGTVVTKAAIAGNPGSNGNTIAVVTSTGAVYNWGAAISYQVGNNTQGTLGGVQQTPSQVRYLNNNNTLGSTITATTLYPAGDSLFWAGV